MAVFVDDITLHVTYRISDQWRLRRRNNIISSREGHDQMVSAGKPPDRTDQTCKEAPDRQRRHCVQR